MENEYEKEINVSYTNVDKNIKLGLVNLICIIQDVSTEYFRKIGLDNIVVKEESGAAWVIRKMSFHIEKYPKWQDYVKLTSYTSEKTKIRLEVEAKAEDENNNLLFVGKQEVHTNNVNYVRYLMNTFDSDFLDKHKITDVEIHYLHESIEGDLLEIYRKDYADNINFLITRNDEEIVRAELDINYIDEN